MIKSEMKRTIPLSRRKIFFLILLAAGFCAVGGFLLTVLDQAPRYNTFLVKGLLSASTILFGLALLYLLYKIFDNSPGLVLDAQGINDNSSALAAGLIPWREITGITITETSGQRFITIQIRNPQRIIQKANYPKKLLMEVNQKWYGSPVQISANSLEIEFDRLYYLIEEYFRRYGSL